MCDVVVKGLNESWSPFDESNESILCDDTESGFEKPKFDDNICILSWHCCPFAKKLLIFFVNNRV